MIIRPYLLKKKIFHSVGRVRGGTGQTQGSRANLPAYCLGMLGVEGWQEQRAWLVLWEVIRPGSLGFVGVRVMLRGLAGLMLSQRNARVWLGWGLGRRDRLYVRRWGCLFQTVLLWSS